MTRRVSLPNMTYEDGRLVYVEKARSGKRPIKRSFRKQSSKTRLKALVKAQKAWRP